MGNNTETISLDTPAVQCVRVAKTPPAVWEIYTLPLIGFAIDELFHTRKNELLLFFLPFLIIILRMFILQFQLPPELPPDSDRRRVRARRNCSAWNHLAIIALFVFEIVAAVASSPSTPPAVFLLLLPFYALYIFLRLLSRRDWILAAGVRDTNE